MRAREVGMDSNQSEDRPSRSDESVRRRGIRWDRGIRVVLGTLGSLLTLGLVTGCVGGRSPGSFGGSSEEPRVPPEYVVEAARSPEGAVIIGTVSAECSFTGHRLEIDDEWLSDVDCGEARLGDALRYLAAENGGELLVEQHCRRGRSLAGRSVFSCRAKVGRYERAHRPAPQRTVTMRHWDDASGAMAWRIRADYESVGEPVERAPRGASNVFEVAEMPLQAKHLGILWTECGGSPCTADAVRAGLRVAAGRLGATHVAGVRCITEADVPRCVADVGYEPALP